MLMGSTVLPVLKFDMNRGQCILVQSTAVRHLYKHAFFIGKTCILFLQSTLHV